MKVERWSDGFSVTNHLKTSLFLLHKWPVVSILNTNSPPPIMKAMLILISMILPFPIMIWELSVLFHTTPPSCMVTIQAYGYQTGLGCFSNLYLVMKPCCKSWMLRSIHWIFRPRQHHCLNLIKDTQWLISTWIKQLCQVISLSQDHSNQKLLTLWVWITRRPTTHI